MRVCLIRHALTRWNEEGRIQGRTDIPLSPAGRAQAASWRVPAGFAGAACVTSPLARARETAAILGFADAPVDDRLLEMAWGEFEGRVIAELRAEGAHGFTGVESDGIDYRAPGGETPREVGIRVSALLDELARGGAADGRIVLVAHKGILRVALVLSLGWDMLGKPPVRYDPERALLLEVAGDGSPPVFIAAEPLRPADAEA